MSLVFSLTVLVLVSVTAFYAFGSFDPGGIISSNETGFAPEETASNETGFAPGETAVNESGSNIPSNHIVNSEQNEKKS